jgi:hypothetical protein
VFVVLNKIIDFQGAIDQETCDSPYHMTDEDLENELLNRGKEAKGNRDEMIKELLKVEHSML